MVSPITGGGIAALGRSFGVLAAIVGREVRSA
jgi:hypothetical protein